MSVETNSHNYTNMNSIFSQFLPARISPKEISGALQKYFHFLIASLKKIRSQWKIPPQTPPFPFATSEFKKISRVFCEILSPENSFRKTESALVPPPLGRIP